MKTKATITTCMIGDLEAEIRYHNRLYYDMSKPELSDNDFDALFDRLKRWAPESPVLNERAQDCFDANFKHIIPMGSQSKCKTAQDLLNKFMGYWVTCTPKLDGAGLSLHYKNGRLALAVSRGRTETGKGKIITPNAQEINGIPKTIPFKGDLEIRGEGVILNSNFYGIMDQPGYDGLEAGYANPRNAASGGLTCRDPRETAARNLCFVPYKAMYETVTFHEEQLIKLESWGFSPPPYTLSEITGVEDIEVLIQQGSDWKGLDSSSEALDYNCDGIVVRIDDEAVYNSLGVSGVCPKGSAAFKYQAIREETILEDIEWNTTRTGIVHPTGVLGSIVIDGSTVSRVTLNNPTWMKKFPGLCIGARVEIEKKNDIIPGLVEVVVPGTGSTRQPTECPSCGAELGLEIKSDGTEGVRLTCFNKASCPAQFLDSTLHMLRKLELKNIAEATINRVITAGLLKNPWDIFDLTAESLKEAGFKKREGEVVLEALKDVASPVAHILASCGTRFWGRRMFLKLLANSEAFTEERLLLADFDYDELVEVKEVGPAKAKALCEAFGKAGDNPAKWAREFFNQLKTRVEVEFSEKIEVSSDSPVSGKTFCLSGSMPRGKKVIEADLIALGGIIKSGVSKNLDFLIAGPGSGSKSKKAEAAGVKILTESELYEMLDK